MFSSDSQRKGVSTRYKRQMCLFVDSTLTRVRSLIRTFLISDTRVGTHNHLSYVRFCCYQIGSLFLHLPHITIFCLCVLHRGLDLVNVHLFHDASNLIACNSSPSIYSANRKRALRYVINRSNFQLHTAMKSVTVKCKRRQQTQI